MSKQSTQPPKFMSATPEQYAGRVAAQHTAKNAEAIAALEARFIQLALAYEKLQKRVEHLEQHSKPIERVW
jgi:hypothetical protein